MTLADLGQAKTVEIGKEKHHHHRRRRQCRDIQARVKQIRIQIEEATSDYDRETARARGQTGRRRGCDQRSAAATESR